MSNVDFINETNASERNIKKSIILVAGMGTRLKPLTNSMPKPLTRVGKRTLLTYNLDNLASNGIEETILVIGYLKKNIVDTIGDFYDDMKITYIENQIFSETNSMYSLWLARKFLESGAILIEGDCIVERKVIKEIVDLDETKSYWIVDKFTKDLDGCMLITDDTRRIVKIQIVREQLEQYKGNMFKSTGILKINPTFGLLFSKWLDEEVKVGNTNLYYDLVLAKHVNDYPLYVHNISGLKWCEIDDINDVKRAEKIFGGGE